MERELNKVNEQSIEKSQPRYFTTLESKVLPFTETHFFNEEGRKKELDALRLHISTVRDEVFRQIPSVSLTDKRRWDFKQRKLIETVHLTKLIEGDLDQVELNPGNYTQGMLSSIHAVSLGVDLFQHSTIRDLVSISKKYSFEDKYIPLAQLMELSAAAPVSIRIGSVMLYDFMNINKKRANPTPYYRYLVEANLDQEDGRQKLFQENQEYPKNLYPNITKQAIVVMQNSQAALLNPTSGIKKVDDPTVSECLKLFMQLSKGIEDVREKTYQSVISPNSEDFQDLSNLIVHYLDSKDKGTRILAIYQIGLNKKQTIIEAYRKARRYEREDNNGEFYMIFGDAIAEYIDEASGSINILSDEDVAAILDGEIPEDDRERSEPAFEQLGKRVNDIFNKTFKKDFAIEPGDINWSQLHVPEEVRINFDSNRPRIFTMKITFNNDLGESTGVECAIDTVKNFMDWNHPEDPMLLPKNSDLMAFRRSLMLAAQSILDNVYRQAQEEYQSRRASQTAPLPVETRRPKRERVQDPVYELRTSRRQQQEQESTNILFDVLSSKEEIKKRVVLPSDEEFEDMVRYLSHVDRDIVRKSIEEYNEKGTGAKFTRKRKVGTEGEIVYGLSIGCSVPKGARVLLRETESEAGTRNFEIVDIRYRKDIYSKNKS